MRRDRTIDLFVKRPRHFRSFLLFILTSSTFLFSVSFRFFSFTNLDKARPHDGCQKKKKKEKENEEQKEKEKGIHPVGGVTSTSGIVRLAHMEGPRLSPRDNRESLSSLVIRGPAFPMYGVG